MKYFVNVCLDIEHYLMYVISHKQCFILKTLIVFNYVLYEISSTDTNFCLNKKDIKFYQLRGWMDII